MYLAFVLLVIVLFSQTVFAISCYSCESAFEPICGESNFDAEARFKLDCDDLAPPRYLENELDQQNATACMKKVYIENGEHKVVRSCYFSSPNLTITSCSPDPALEPVEVVSCNVCGNESYCNGAKLIHEWALVQQISLALTFRLITKLFNYK